MNCPKCLKKTTVTTTRTPAKPGKGNDVHVSAMLEEANKGHGRQVWDKNAGDK